MTPKVRYVRNGDIRIAWCALGDGPIDIMFVPGMMSHIDQTCADPNFESWIARLTPFARIILLDKRGTGLSDRAVRGSTMEDRMDDLRAVLDAAQSAKAAVIGESEGGPLAALFAATYPERTIALILGGAVTTMGEIEGWDEHNRILKELALTCRNHWGEGRTARFWVPDLAGNPEVVDEVARFERASLSPQTLADLLDWGRQIDVRPIVGSIKVPTLVWHRTGDAAVVVQHGRWYADNIRGARMLEEPGTSHIMYYGDTALPEAIQKLLTGKSSAPVSERVLATVLFTDIVDSTGHISRLGDSGWRDLLARYHLTVRGELSRFRGSEMDNAGDGFFATFDGPARAVQCAARISAAANPLGIKVRAGVHTGECEKSADKVVGIAVHIASRVMGQARPGEVLVSRTVRDLVAGSGLSFEARGSHALKGVPDEWELFAVGA